MNLLPLVAFPLRLDAPVDTGSVPARSSTADSFYRRFEIRCGTCCSYRVEVVGRHDHETSQLRIVLRCRHCQAEEKVRLS